MLLKSSIIKVSKMRQRGMVFAVMFVTSFVFMWNGFVNQTYVQEDGKCVNSTQIPTLDCTPAALFQLNSSCCPHKVCPEGHFPFFLRSGTANVVGPKICFNNKIVMSGGQNNVGNGVNIVLVNGENGEILKSSYFNVHYLELLDFLQTIQDGNIVLVVSYEDPASVLTDEIREHFSRVGSAMIHSVKYRDSWVFAGAASLNGKSPFEKLIVNDEERNAYGEWPDMEELSGCFPRKISSALN